MADPVFGLDFGTTNSLPALVVNGEMQAFTDSTDNPHPSVVWYRGSEVVVGRKAREHIDSLSGGGAPGFVRSPKMRLRRDGPVHVGGRILDPGDIVSEVLRHIRDMTEARHDRRIESAVMTVPVDFAGPQRRRVRQAAQKAGIRVARFVHEPVAALYAYIRERPNVRRELEASETSAALVFDWGGGTLDLTVCRVVGGIIMQVASVGNGEIGGDRFDERLRNLIRERHIQKYEIADIAAREQPGVDARLLNESEQAKIELSNRDTFPVVVEDYLRGSGEECNLRVDISRTDLEDLSRDLVGQGLGEVDKILEQAGLDRLDIGLCLATGGMVNMPAIRNGLVERFRTRAPMIDNQDSIIAEGAAWIAHDNLDIRLSKPLEVLVADGRDQGSWLPLIDTNFLLPIENQVAPAESRQFFCTDPSDGIAIFKFGKPQRVGPTQPKDERETLAVLRLPVDLTAEPFVERLECRVEIDENYIAKVVLKSNGAYGSVSEEIHSLDFGLVLPAEADGADSE